MADRDIRSVFEVIDGSPEGDFRDRLRATVLEACDDRSAVAFTTRAKSALTKEATMVDLDPSPRYGRRQLAMLLGVAAAILVVIVAVGFALRGSDTVVTDNSIEPTPQTSAPTPTASSQEATTTTSPTTTTLPATPTTAEPTATTAARSGPHPTLPAAVPAGTQQLVDAVVPFEVTLAQPWERRLDFEERVLLARPGDAGEEEILMIFDQVGDASAEAILPLVCPDNIQLTAPVPINLLGETGFVVTGSTAGECSLGRIGGSGFFVAADSSLVLAAVTVDDHVFVVVADAPSAAGQGFVDEMISTIESITRIG